MRRKVFKKRVLREGYLREMRVVRVLRDGEFREEVLLCGSNFGGLDCR